MADKIRLVGMSDVEQIIKIYAPYVENTIVSFESEVPTIKEMRERIRNICEKYPYLVYLSDNQIVAYAYASKYRDRAAYCYDVEISVYSLPEYHGKGIAHKLYECLFAILREQGFYNAYAGCSLPNEKSINFHKKFGFTCIGVYHNVGYKFGSWHDVMWLEKAIMPHCKNPKAVKSIGELPENIFEFDEFLKD